MRVSWTARRSNQSILKEISPVCSLEGLMLKLKLQYFGHLIRRVDLLEKITPPPPQILYIIPLPPSFSLNLWLSLFFFLLFLTFFILLLFLECHVVGIIPYVAFLYWLLSLNNIQLILSSVFSWLDSSFLFSAE